MFIRRGTPNRPLTQLDQHHRRERMLAAASRQAVNGYDAVQIRAVADAAGVSVSSVYHHFPSKDGLLLECLYAWLCEFTPGEAPATIGVSEPHHRLLRILESLTGELSSAPRLADAMARAYLNATGAASRKADLVRDRLIQIFTDALQHEEPDWPDHNHQVAALVTDVWIANVLAVAQSRTTTRDLLRRLGHALSAISENADQRRHAAVISQPAPAGSPARCR
ncbi:TetR/AcrR family transcriptional regulator [Mycolicibacter heraklionensis]|uniref:TetR/AcrR family transcriptional regulator n=1 Tax=Mycolicibacter heraklionensis TaxID=512402 RepID=UPI0013F4C5A0|nr:TetR/AcrR family transcriptional regulator [Mycolicibacter heraklionensis]